MSIGNPIAFVFLSVIPIIVALYLLRLRRKKYVVSSTFFWTEMVQDLQANVPFQKLRWNLLLFLQVFIAMAIIFALANPAIKATLNEGRRTIFIIDTSASMSSRSGTSTRLDEVLTSIRTYCNALSKREEVMIIGAGERAEILLDFTHNLPAIERVLEAIKSQDSRCDLQTALALAQNRGSAVDDPHIVIASDFSGLNPELFENIKVPMSFLQSRNSGRNVGITDFSVPLAEGNSSDTISPFISVRNYTDKDISCDINFFANGDLIDVRSMDIAANTKVARQFSNVPFAESDEKENVIRAELDIDDDFSVDNVAWAIPDTGESMNVLLAGEDEFLLLCLLSVPGVKVFQVSESEFAPDSRYHLVFFSGWAPDILPPGNYVFFDPPARDYLPAKPGEEIQRPKVTDWEDGHPLLRFVNPGSFEVFSAHKLETVPGSLVLIESNKSPLMVYSERNYLRALQFNFDLTSSDLITRPTFPILIYNITSFFREYSVNTNTGIQTQGITGIKVDTLSDKVTLRGSENFERQFPVDAGHVYLDVDKTGIYELEIPSGTGITKKTIAANFFDEVEGDISGKTSLDLNSENIKVERFEVIGEKRIWQWLGYLALLVLCVEWFFYHRKGF